MELTKLQRTVIDALEDVKAQDIKVFNTLGQSDLFDRMIVASGTSNRQTKALAWHVVEKVKAAGGQVVSVEGTDPGAWVLVDLGDIVVHVMQPAVRQYYGLEEVWGAKPVRVKLGTPDKAKVKKAAPKKPATKKAPVKKAAAKRPAKKAPPKRTTTTAKTSRKRS
ncbi:MAG: ribosome silencing factor [Betaproteobacteria bacterium]